ncbi:hypothetical protein AB0B56_17475 [Streptosporangium canum]|uniref:hypothetical protein n=1 Tax=Streptosporangium canum TaxID=324952 RepID=UPI003416738F
MTWWQQLILILAGAIVGSASSITTTLLTMSHQRKLEAEKLRGQEVLERTKRLAERDMTAAATTHAVIAQLLRLPASPSEDLEWERRKKQTPLKEWVEKYRLLSDDVDDWSRKRSEILLDLRMAMEGFSNSALRDEIWWAHLALQGIGLISFGDMRESRSRDGICQHVLRCIANASLNEELPRRSDSYQKCLDDMRRYYAPSGRDSAAE